MLVSPLALVAPDWTSDIRARTSPLLVHSCVPLILCLWRYEIEVHPFAWWKTYGSLKNWAKSRAKVAYYERTFSELAAVNGVSQVLIETVNPIWDLGGFYRRLQLERRVYCYLCVSRVKCWTQKSPFSVRQRSLSLAASTLPWQRRLCWIGAALRGPVRTENRPTEKIGPVPHYSLGGLALITDRVGSKCRRDETQQ